MNERPGPRPARVATTPAGVSGAQPASFGAKSRAALVQTTMARLLGSCV